MYALVVSARTGGHPIPIKVITGPEGGFLSIDDAMEWMLDHPTETFGAASKYADDSISVLPAVIVEAEPDAPTRDQFMDYGKPVGRHRKD